MHDAQKNSATHNPEMEINYAAAAKWFRKAAEQGHMKAQYCLGQLYQAGKGVPRDLPQAKAWFQKAAAQGHANSARRLEKLEKGAQSPTSKATPKKTLPEIFDMMERKRAPTMDVRFALAQKQVAGDPQSIAQIASKGSSKFAGLKPGLKNAAMGLSSGDESWETIPTQTLLDQYLIEGNAVIGFYQAQDRLLIAAAACKGGQVKMIPLSENDLESRLRKLRNDLELAGLSYAEKEQAKRDLGAMGKMPDMDGTDHDENWQKQLRQLYLDLIAPIEPVLASANRIYILPHGPALMCPFAALMDAQGKFMVERFELIYAPTLNMVSNALRQDREMNRVAQDGMMVYTKNARGCYIGNPDGSLPGAQEECEKIAELGLGDDDFLLRGGDATIHYLKTWGTAYGRCTLLHIACHGVYNAENPELSYLQLAPGKENDDGRLTFGQIQCLDLNTVQLVTLSACSTAVTDPQLQKEVNWLAIGFLLGGAKSVVGTQWKVDDAYTPQFMLDLYRPVKKESVATCLRKAMLTAIENGIHPYVWAPFILMGDPGPLVTKVMRTGGATKYG